MIKKRYIDGRSWRWVLRRSSVWKRLEEGQRGYIALTHMHEVHHPICVGKDGLCVADAGHRWLAYLPDNQHHLMWTMFNPAGEILQWYFDITLKNDVDAEGPYALDLYLDLVMTPDGQIFVLDEDELDEALKSGEITKTQYELAHEEKERLCAQIRGKAEALQIFSRHLLTLLEPSLKGILNASSN